MAELPCRWGINGKRVALIWLIWTTVKLKPLAASQASSIYRRNVFKDVELADAALLTNGISNMATPIQCAAWCSKRGCNGYSFTPRAAAPAIVGGRAGASDGICKIGSNPFSRQTKVGSKLYVLTSDSNPGRTDGFNYTRYGPSSYTFAQAKAQCLVDRKGNLPVVYPNAVSFRMVNKTLQSPTETAFVDIRRLGHYADRKFITGLGDVIDAANKDSDSAQAWAAGQPDAVSNATGSYVLVSWAGWQDVSNTQTANVVICQSDSASYRLVPDTGTYYKYARDPLAQADADRTCKADGGRLLIPYGAGNSIFAVLAEFGETTARADIAWIGGNLDLVNYQWIFEDGTRLNFTRGYTGQDAQEYKQKWWPGEPTRFPAENCLRLGIQGYIDHWCDALLSVLCERDAGV